MDISQVNYEPWKVVRELGRGSFGTVYEISREEFGETYKAALKVISIPQSPNDIVASRADGMDDRSITAYYNSMVQELTHEFALLSRLKGFTNIVSYEDHKVVQHEDGIGWDIYIRMELLTSLTAIAASRYFTKKEVMKLGIDICNALILCEQKNIIHRDIKPDNIFISANGDFKLGDFGIARTAAKTMSNMSRKGTPNYMAPEVYMSRPYNVTADIYSLGIVLYQLMNHKRLPFMPAQVTVTNREEALGLRMSGRPLPLPEQADPKFAAVILKACAFRPEERYASAQFMKEDLEILMAEEKRGVSAGAARAQFTAQNVQLAQAQTSQHTDPPQTDQYAQPVQKQTVEEQTMGRDNQRQDKDKKILFGLIGVAAVLFIGVVILALSVFRGGDAEGTTEVTASAGQFAEETPAGEQEEAEEKIAEEAAVTELSDDLADFTFELEGNVYQLPVPYADLKAAGWEIIGSESDKLVPGGFLYYYLSNDTYTIDCEIFNASDNTKEARDCDIVELWVDARENVDFCIAKGIGLSASVEEVRAAFGKPSFDDIYDGGGGELEYSINDEAVVIFFYNSEGALDGILLHNNP